MKYILLHISSQNLARSLWDIFNRVQPHSGESAIIACQKQWLVIILFVREVLVLSCDRILNYESISISNMDPNKCTEPASYFTLVPHIKGGNEKEKGAHVKGMRWNSFLLQDFYYIIISYTEKRSIIIMWMSLHWHAWM